MKKLSHFTCFAVFIAFFTTLGVNAQITIGNGTAYTEKYPINGYYNYSWSNTIYLKSQINTSGSLISIAFYVDNSTANLTMNNQKIYVRHTTATGYSSTTYEGPTGFTEVFSGDITINGSGWKTITFSTPFNYNGNDNLEFLFENRDGSYVTTFPYYRYTSAGTGNNRTRRDYQDAQFPSSCYLCALSTTFPNIQLNIVPCSFNSGTASASPSTIVPGNTATMSLAGQETAGSTYQWQSSTDNISFTNISGATSSTYSEVAYQTKYFRAIVTNGGCSKASTTATLTADLSTMTTKTIGTGTTQTEKYPFNNYYDYSWSNMIYKASEIGTSGLLSRASFSVATLPANYTANYQKIYVRHTTENVYTANTYPTTAGFTKVYEGDINYTATGWLEVVFDNQFYYNGTDNLEFLFENRDGSYTVNYPVFNSTIMTDTRTRRDYKDASFPETCTNCNRVTNLMNVQLKFFPCTNTAGTASATSSSLCSGTNTTLSLSSQTAGSTIQWQSSTDNVTFTNISGATSASYTTPNLTVTTYYKAITTVGICPVSSNTVTVGVSSTTAGTASATNTSICQGTTASLSVAGQSAGSTIQWQSSTNNVTFTDISGATSASYITGALTSGMYYRAVVGKSYCTVNTNSVSITVNTVNVGTASATSTTVLPFGSSTISVSGQTASSTIQWQSSTDNTTFTNITTATNASYDALNIVQTTYYKAIVTSPEGCIATTNTVTVTVDESTLTTKSIGTGTVTFDKYPFNGYYDYSWSNMLYKAAEINGSGKLTKVSFYVDNSPVNEVMNNQIIYVRHTATTEFADPNHPTTAGFTKVFEGTITYNGSGWKEITLQTPFEYNGVDDLEFLFENRDGSWTTTHPIFRGQSGMPDVRVRRDYKDADFPTACTNCLKFNNILNIQMKFLPCSAAAGTISATQTSVKPASNIEVNLTGQQSGAAIQWEQSEDNYNFKVIANQTGTALAIPMTITPLYIKAVSTVGCASHTNVVTITPDNCFMPISEVGTGANVTEKYPFDVYYNNSWSSTIYTAAEIGTAGTITSVAFNVTNAPENYTTNNQIIYVRTTSEIDYPTTDYPGITGFTKVYEGPINYRGTGWKEIPFQTPFVYDGTSNLEFLFESRDGSYGFDYPTFAYTSGMSTYRVKRDYKDEEFPVTCANCGRSMNIPNVKIKFQAPANPAGTVLASETEVCAGKNSILRLNNPVAGSSIQWKKSTDNNTFTVIEGATSEVYITADLEETTYYRADVTLGSCTAISNTETIAVVGSCTTAISTFNGESGTGEVVVDIASIMDKVGPYHYYISEFPIPDLIESYYYLKDTIYGDTIPVDSIQFFLGDNSATSHLFSNLESGSYYVATFDSRGIRIFNDQIVVQPSFNFDGSTGLTSSGISIIAVQDNSKGTVDGYMTDGTQATLKLDVVDPQKNQYYGLLSSETEFIDQSSLLYGFNVTNSKVYTIENGTQSTTYTTIGSNSELELRQVEGNLEYVIAGIVSKSVILPTPPFILKSGIGLQSKGAILGAKFDKFKFKKYTFLTHITNGNCGNTPLHFTFSVAPVKNNFTSHPISYNISGPNGFNYNGTGYTMSPNPSISFSGLAGGVYTITGNIQITVGSTSTIIPFTELIYVGYETEWPLLINYISDPNTYSVKKANITSTGIADGRAKNTLMPGDIGWVSFEPVMLTQPIFFNKENYFVFSQNTSVIPSIPASTDTYFTFEKVNFLSYRIRANGYSASNPSVLDISYSQTFSYSSGTKVRVMVTATTLELWVNNVLKKTLARPTGMIRLKTNSRNVNDGFKNILASFGCPVQTLATIGYSELRKDKTAGYALAVQGKVKFTFDEEYKIETGKFLPVKIYDDNHVLVVQSDLNGVVTNLNPSDNTTSPSTEIVSSELLYNFDDNRYTLTLANIEGITLGNYYTIEVVTSTGDKRFLRILYKS